MRRRSVGQLGFRHRHRPPPLEQRPRTAPGNVGAALRWRRSSSRVRSPFPIHIVALSRPPRLCAASRIRRNCRARCRDVTSGDLPFYQDPGPALPLSSRQKPRTRACTGRGNPGGPCAHASRPSASNLGPLALAPAFGSADKTWYQNTTPCPPIPRDGHRLPQHRDHGPPTTRRQTMRDYGPPDDSTTDRELVDDSDPPKVSPPKVGTALRAVRGELGLPFPSSPEPTNPGPTRPIQTDPDRSRVNPSDPELAKIPRLRQAPLPLPLAPRMSSVARSSSSHWPSATGALAAYWRCAGCSIPGGSSSQYPAPTR
jgi:hypothetical protein